MPKSRRRHTRRIYGGRLACRTSGQKAVASARQRQPRRGFGRVPLAYATARRANELPVVAVASFRDDARRLLTQVQLQALKRHVRRELGEVLHEDCGTLRVREVPFAGFKILVYDDWIAGEIQLIGLKPITGGDGPHSPTGKARTAIRRALTVGMILGYELVKQWLRDLLGYGRPSTAAVRFSEHEGVELLASCKGNRKLDWALGERMLLLAEDAGNNFAVLTKAQDFDVIGTWYLRTDKQCWAHNYPVERSRLAFDRIVEEQSVIEDLGNEHCFLGRQTFLISKAVRD